MPTTGAQSTDMRAVIRAINEQFLRNVRARDVEALVGSFYAEDARVLPPNRPPVQGRAGIREMWSGLLPQIQDMTLETQHLEASDDLAYEVGRYTLRLADAVSEGKYLVVFRHLADGSWRAVADMFSPNQ